MGGNFKSLPQSEAEMALLKHLLFLCLLLWVASSQKICKDSEGDEITSCNRCLWEPNCKWCTTRGEEGLAIGCVKNDGYQCNDKFEKTNHTDNVIKLGDEINTDSTLGP